MNAWFSAFSQLPDWCSRCLPAPRHVSCEEHVSQRNKNKSCLQSCSQSCSHKSRQCWKHNLRNLSWHRLTFNLSHGCQKPTCEYRTWRPSSVHIGALWGTRGQQTPSVQWLMILRWPAAKSTWRLRWLHLERSGGNSCSASTSRTLPESWTWSIITYHQVCSHAEGCTAFCVLSFRHQPITV